MKYLTLITLLCLMFALQLQISHAQGWFWQNPLPQGNNLLSVVFINETTGCSVGDHGTILRTEDGGSTWTLQTSGTTANLYGVSFSDSDHGTIVGEGGTILRTEDGGTTWTIQNSGTTNPLSGVSFSDAEHGTAVGGGGTILRTEDGGSTWTIQNSGTTYSLSGVSFSDAEHGTIVGGGGTILRTEDGGTTWTIQNSGTTNPLSGVSFSDADHGTAVGYYGTILRTEDGGTNWTAQTSGTTRNLRAVSFSDAEHGTAVGGGGTILRTEDGGTTWIAQTSGTTYYLYGVSFSDAEHGTAVGDLGTILRTEDGGTTWTEQNSGMTFHSDLLDVCFSDAEHGTAVGGGGTILRTEDGGTTWIAQTSGTTRNLHAVSFSDAEHGTAVGGGGTILRTEDGGTTWIAQTSGTTRDLYGVSFSDADHGTAVGYYGTILRTTDGGTNWTAQNSNTTVWLIDVCFSDTDHGTAVGLGGTILRTEDGGTTWIAQTSGTTYYLYGVSFSDAEHGTAVGDHGTILRTTDGGTTWTEQNSGTTNPLYGVSFSDTDHGTAVGGEGTILRTEDGGTTWIAQTSGTTYYLYGVSFSDTDHGTAVGYYGTILRTNVGGGVTFIIKVPDDVPTIQAGIDSAHDGNIVLVDEDIYYENINFKGKAITVASHYFMDGDTNHISKTIIDGSQPSHPDSGSVVTFRSGEDTTSVLMGFTITGGTGKRYVDQWGFVSRQGGGVDIILSGAKIVSNRIIDNHLPNVVSDPEFGAGINVSGYSEDFVIVSDNEIVNNSITASYYTQGAGVSMGTSGTIRFTGNLVEGNSNANISTRCAIGGGIYIWGGTLQGQLFNGTIIISGNIFKNNNVTPGTGTLLSQGGGGVYIDLCSPELTNNIIIDNNAPRGGGVLVCGVHRGGMTGNANPILINNTISGNIASQSGGGIYSYGNPANAAQPKVMNSILWNDSAPVGSEIFGTAVTVVYSDVEGSFTGEGNIDADPQFADTLYHLSESSPCIGAGINSVEIGGVWYYCPDNCFFGNPRPDPTDTNPDMGACESPLEEPAGIDPVGWSYLPNTYRLGQNYPNPFNPTTMINYQLPMTSEVELSIYNLLGQKVTTLVNKRKRAGYHQVEWDASGFASGIYLYRLEAEGHVETKKMVLMR